MDVSTALILAGLTVAAIVGAIARLSRKKPTYLEEFAEPLAVAATLSPRVLFVVAVKGPVVEEALFRWAPLLTGSPAVVAAAQVAWIALHEPWKYRWSTLPSLVAGAMIFTGLAMQAFWLSLLYHSLHNLAMVASLVGPRTFAATLLSHIRSLLRRPSPRPA